MNDAHDIGAGAAVLKKCGDRIRQEARPFVAAIQTHVGIPALDGHRHRHLDCLARKTGLWRPVFIEERLAGRSPRGNAKKGAYVHAHAGQRPQRLVSDPVDSRSAEEQDLELRRPVPSLIFDSLVHKMHLFHGNFPSALRRQGRSDPFLTLGIRELEGRHRVARLIEQCDDDVAGIGRAIANPLEPFEQIVEPTNPRLSVISSFLKVFGICRAVLVMSLPLR